MVRTVHKENQKVRAYGGAYAFTVALWDRHARDFDELRIIDTARGELWTGGANAIEFAVRAVLHPGIGEQVLVLCSKMQLNGASTTTSHAPAFKFEHNASERGEGVPTFEQDASHTTTRPAVLVFGQARADDFKPKRARRR